ncbi:hypothetical protein KP509_03G074400 [Ceratopteris richardii]|uniref:DUF1648 domain-containing protein n=1 Tax=Ceratopteris richardii TaxID=49495 RepID=A0A8T2V152_CERRI|nr:hypothetical protein KP509_03G074400 [Ceratopteris richardii]
MAAGNNPAALPLLLAVCSIVVMAYSWSSSPESVALWWSAHGHPVLYGPRWLGLLAFPFLQIVIPYILYQVACRDERLDGQSGESANAIANIIALPSVLLFVEYVLVYLPTVLSSSQDFLPRIFTSNIAIWALFWLGYNLQYVEPNSSIGVPVFVPLSQDDIWMRTHQRAGLILMGFGLILFVFSLACPIGVPYMAVSLVIWLGAYVLVILDSYMICTIENTAIVRAENLRQPLTSEA